jgi:hypothetical protein
MTRNVGGLDRGLRLAAGLILVPLGVVMLSARCPCGWINLALGLAALVTGLLGFCVLYLPFGFSTARKRSPGTPPSHPE